MLTMAARLLAKLYKPCLLPHTRIAATQICHNVLRQTGWQTRPRMRTIYTNSAKFNRENVAFENDSTEIESSSSKQYSGVQAMLARVFEKFEFRCQTSECVIEKNFVETFADYTRALDSLDMEKISNRLQQNLSIYTSILLRSCGRLMIETPPKAREILAGNLWALVKEKKIQLDTSHYNCLLKTLNENETVYEPEKFLEEMKSLNLTPDRVTHQRLIHQYCLQGNTAGATKLMESLKESVEFELSESVFASLIIGYSKQADNPGYEEIFKLMRENNVEPGELTYTAAISTLASEIDTNPSKMQELEKLLEKVKQEDIQFSQTLVPDLITQLGSRAKSSPIIGDFITNIANCGNSAPFRYRVLLAILNCDLPEEASNLFWSNYANRKIRQSSVAGTHYLRALASAKKVSDEFAVNECKRMKEEGINDKSLDIFMYISASNGRMSLYKAALKALAEDQKVKHIHIWPLLAQSKSEEDLVDALKHLSPDTSAAELLETFSEWVWSRYLETPDRLIELNREHKFVDTSIVVASFLSHCVKHEKIAEAVKFINEAPPDLIVSSQNIDIGDHSPQSLDLDDVEEGVEGVDLEDREPQIKPRFYRRPSRNAMLIRLLDRIAEKTKDPALVKKAFSMCNVPQEGTMPQGLGSLISVHLNNNDLKSALDEFERIAKEHNATPRSIALIHHCLENKDPESLQRIVDIGTNIHGQQNALFDLAVGCIHSKKEKQAKKILGSQGFRVRGERVYKAAYMFARAQRVDELEILVRVTRDLPDVNVERLYKVLLDVYDRTGNAARAIHLYNMMQDEDFQPSKNSLQMIAKVLKKHNIKVPFSLMNSAN